MLPTLDFAELRKAPHWSFSALNSLLNICSLQYAFGRIYKQTPEFIPINLVFGKAFHVAASYYLNTMKDSLPADDTELKDAFAQSLQDEINRSHYDVPLAEGKSIDDYIIKGHDMLLCLKEQFDPGDEILGTDMPFKVDLVDQQGKRISKPLIGEFDALIKRKDCYIIVDFKTAASRWPADKCHKDLQATAYLYAMRQSISQETLFRYDVITKAKKPTYTGFMTNRTKDDFQRFMELVKVADKIVEDSLYYPHETTFACGGCQYSSSCLEWQKTCPERRLLKEVHYHAA